MDALINEILNPVLPNPDNFPRRLRLPVIEISSRGSLGKTQLLYYICAVSTLPIWLKGKDSAVVVIDCPCKFDVKRLYVVMRGYAIKQQFFDNQKPLTDRQLHKTILGALTHVHIFQPKNSGQLLATIKNIKPYLYGETEHKHLSGRKKVDCIMIDGISRFIWEDRFHDYGAVMVDEDHPDWIDLWGRYEEITNELRAVAISLCCFIVITNIGFNLRYDPDKAPVLYTPGDKSTQYRPAKVTAWHRYYEPWRLDLPTRPPSFARPYLAHVLPQPWTPFVNVKLVLQRAKDSVPRFPKGTSMLWAIKNRKSHLVAVNNGGIVGFADPIGLGGGLQRLVQAVNNGTGNFYLQIRENEVDVTT